MYWIKASQLPISELAHSTVGSVLTRTLATERLLRVTAYIQRFAHAAKGNPVDKSDLTLTAGEIQIALVYWIKVSQLPMSELAHFQQWSRQFELFLDESGIWRRLGNADVPNVAKHPILLNRDHHLTTLIVRDCHERVRQSCGPDTRLCGEGISSGRFYAGAPYVVDFKGSHMYRLQPRHCLLSESRKPDHSPSRALFLQALSMCETRQFLERRKFGSAYALAV